MDQSTIAMAAAGISLAGVVVSIVAQWRARNKDAIETARKEGEDAERQRNMVRRLDDLEKRADQHDVAREELSVLRQAVHDMKNGIQRVETGLQNLRQDFSSMVLTGGRSSSRATAER